MTLYRWMHWFWITTLNPYFFVILLFRGSLVQSLPVPLVPVVQNGHQNGPYVTKLPFDTSSKMSNSKPNDRNDYHTANYQEIVHLSPGDRSTSDENIPEHFSAEDELETPSLPDDVQSEHLSTIPMSDKPTSVPKTYPQFPFKTSSKLREKSIIQSKKSLLPDTNDNDDTVGVLLRSALNHDLTLTSVAGDHGTSTESYQEIEDTKQKAIPVKDLGDQLLGDEPFNPTGSFINSTNVHSKLNMKPNSSTMKSTTLKSDSILMPEKPPIGHRSKTINREKTIQERNQAAADLQNEMSPVLYVTPNSLNDTVENRPELNEGTNNGSNNSDWNNTTSVLSDDSTIVQNVEHWDNKSDNIKSLASINHKVDAASGVVPVSKERVSEVDQRGLDAASVTGIALGILSSAGLIGGISFVLYRRRYLNKPQTLNDSNPDSIGYLDDSTLRENSEEMYSLDNDSFLNSLEAMTIQNYWTDSVKHTKL